MFVFLFLFCFLVKSDWLSNPINQKLVICYHSPLLPSRKKEEEKTLSWQIRNSCNNTTVMSSKGLCAVFWRDSLTEKSSDVIIFLLCLALIQTLTFIFEPCFLSLMITDKHRRDGSLTGTETAKQNPSDTYEKIQLLKHIQCDWSILDVPSILILFSSGCSQCFYHAWRYLFFTFITFTEKRWILLNSQFCKIYLLTLWSLLVYFFGFYGRNWNKYLYWWILSVMIKWTEIRKPSENIANCGCKNND